MNFANLFKIAVKALSNNKLRGFLTMLGIIIGVASVIILVSIVNGYMSYMVESFSSMGVNQITVQYKAVASRSIDVNEFMSSTRNIQTSTRTCPRTCPSASR